MASVVAEVVAPWRSHPALADDLPADARGPLIDLAVGDLLALTQRARSGRVLELRARELLLLPGRPAFRIAHLLWRRADGASPARAARLQALARAISEHSKALTGTEIHPSATIGERFVVDHGFGTVIGESAVIGSDCYMLQAVVLGATGIAHNGSGKRHPTLGDRVQVGAFARILGPVVVGSDVVIGPHAVITESLPDASRVVVVNQYQVVNGGGGLFVTGVVPVGAGAFEVCGYGLTRPDLVLTFVDAEHLPVHDVEIEVLARAADRLRCRVRWRAGARTRAAQYLRVTAGDGASVTLIPPGGMQRALRATVLLQPPPPVPAGSFNEEASA